MPLRLTNQMLDRCLQTAYLLYRVSGADIRDKYVVGKSRTNRPWVARTEDEF